MLRIIVWCLPIQEEEQYNRLHRAIVAVVKKTKSLGVKDENDMLCLFPRDLMSYGLGSQIVIEVQGACLVDALFAVRRDVAQALGRAVKQLYPEADVECEVSNVFHASEPIAWSSRGQE